MSLPFALSSLLGQNLTIPPFEQPNRQNLSLLNSLFSGQSLRNPNIVKEEVIREDEFFTFIITRIPKHKPPNEPLTPSEIPTLSIPSLSSRMSIEQSNHLPILSKNLHSAPSILENNQTRHTSIEDAATSCSINNEKSTWIEPKISDKKPQNRIKNIPGLVLQRVRTSIKEFLNKNCPISNRFIYIQEILAPSDKGFLKGLVCFLDTYKKDWKTWKTITTYLLTNRKCGQVLLRVILGFLGERGNWDFSDWLGSGKLSPKTKKTISTEKSLIFNKFSSIYSGNFN